ncbi:MAG: hypothetical protein Ct9H300mP15_13590 [Gemmatimonadota bacterium]|nr:MAG: hypothetical protein Ct9H300mP15_13590 [Gemmatimonadota bacterium]
MAELTDQDRNEMRELIEEKWVAGGLARDWGCVYGPLHRRFCIHASG